MSSDIGELGMKYRAPGGSPQPPQSKPSTQKFKRPQRHSITPSSSAPLSSKHCGRASLPANVLPVIKTPTKQDPTSEKQRPLTAGGGIEDLEALSRKINRRLASHSGRKSAPPSPSPMPRVRGSPGSETNAPPATGGTPNLAQGRSVYLRFKQMFLHSFAKLLAVMHWKQAAWLLILPLAAVSFSSNLGGIVTIRYVCSFVQSGICS
ncbi:hypothetical protein GALMADRAFT_1031636 [Galerina marginata CBS 339.88]|uniref:Uncharacterized protein n=1 Tax=Galerina marginata (strain CBS 339.88) TaxID=685588 RepID=A0A067SD07_GALM3|nr:hypothetical protein GALMADRAFT_1031636 [Galerina marginata CBS 339.88]